MASDKKIGVREALRKLETYRWSSYPDYIGLKNFPSVTRREFFLTIFNGSDQHKKEMELWTQEAKFDIISDVALEEI